MKKPEESAHKAEWILYAETMEFHLKGADREIDRLANEVKDLNNPYRDGRPPPAPLSTPFVKGISDPKDYCNG